MENGESIKIRDASTEDAEAIGEINVKTWQHAYKDQMPEELLGNLSIPETTERWKRSIEVQGSKRKIIVAEDSGKIVDYCSFGPSRDEDATQDTGEVYTIYIEHKIMGKGIGSKLLAKAMSDLKGNGFEKATLWVLTTNTPTIKFYEKHGWFSDGKTKEDRRRGAVLHETRYAVKLQ